MIRMKIVAAAVAALCVCGAAAAIFWPDDDDGWYAWGPTVGDIDYSKISATPRIIDAIEQMYGLVHGDIPDPVIG
ncbi:MAG: hypothetical protein FWG58_04670, partial [Methanomassiliicoccaceae archaeon]|nr:hypothetical protein [Methanomassiliicoccaceae archaeon]